MFSLSISTEITAKYIDPEDEIAGECIQIRALAIFTYVFAGEICEAVAAEKVFSRSDSTERGARPPFGRSPPLVRKLSGRGM